MARTYPGLYRAKCLSIRDGEIEAVIPQVFATTPVKFTSRTGDVPTAGATGWVMFEGGVPNYPVWMGSTTNVVVETPVVPPEPPAEEEVVDLVPPFTVVAPPAYDLDGGGWVLPEVMDAIPGVYGVTAAVPEAWESFYVRVGSKPMDGDIPEADQQAFIVVGIGQNEDAIDFTPQYICAREVPVPLNEESTLFGDVISLAAPTTPTSFVSAGDPVVRNGSACVAAFVLRVNVLPVEGNPIAGLFTVDDSYVGDLQVTSLQLVRVS